MPLPSVVRSTSTRFSKASTASVSPRNSRCCTSKLDRPNVGIVVSIVTSSPWLEATKNRAMDTFNRDIIPGLQEQFGTFGLGANDSDFQSSVLREGASMSAQLADTAQDRQFGAANALPGLLSGFGELEAGLQGLQTGRTQGGRTMNFLNNLAGMSTQGQTGGGSRANSSEGGVKCWVAAVYFGWDPPNWHTARTWLLETWQGPLAGSFRWFYSRFGERLAALARRNRVVHAALRPIFMWALRMGSK